MVYYGTWKKPPCKGWLNLVFVFNLNFPSFANVQIGPAASGAGDYVQVNDFLSAGNPAIPARRTAN